jgi:uncharacterized SAM-binding protein YcdF (DUF218 family)
MLEKLESKRFWLWMAAVAGGLYVVGFALFAASLPKAPNDLSHVQGIVALTGGEMRIDAANALFEQGVGTRLLISGVHPNTTKAEIKKLIHGGERFDCCVDLGYAAENTHENAREAAAWARFYRFDTLLIVTARYHMPRSLAEFREAMPGVRIVPYPIDPDSPSKGGGRDLRALKVLHREYVKFLAATILNALGLEPKRTDQEASDVKAAALA